MSDRVVELIDGPRIGVCGGRDYDERETVEQTLNALVPDPISFTKEGKHMAMWPVIVHGDASGADSLADDWASGKDVGVDKHPAEWEIHGRAAGPIRNQEMVDSGLDLLIAFPGGRGTADMKRRCRVAGILIAEVDENGKITTDE